MEIELADNHPVDAQVHLYSRCREVGCHSFHGRCSGATLLDQETSIFVSAPSYCHPDLHF